ncbi:MAG: ARMT1-like domain-containing protein [Thermodesulfobacteriota bacterium]|nr:ARMT1-like domain-containing protein [Thermodesulfobacteriota bacterium]
MKTYLDCLPCFLRQALEATRMVTDNEVIQRKVLDCVMERLLMLPLDVAPPEIALVVHRLVKEVTGELDPYRKIKKRYNQTALSLYPQLKKMVEKSKDQLLSAIKVAIAGNVMDLAVHDVRKDFEKGIYNMLSSHFAIDDYDEFKRVLNGSQLLLYLGDNAGEIVFDIVLIEELKMIKDLEIIYVVRENPIINDVTMEDAEFVGMKNKARVISSGSDAPATILSQCSRELLELFQKADMIIAKGQGNYESLSDETNIFFLLISKCPIIAKDLKVNVGDIILKFSSI